MCPYHHWTYDTRGRLVAVPMEIGFPDLDRSQRGLVRLPVVERFGLVWVAATPGAEIDLDAYLGEALVAELEHYRFERYHSFKSTTIPAAMNWKLMYDTFLEFYHAYFTHARTLRQLKWLGFRGNPAPDPSWSVVTEHTGEVLYLQPSSAGAELIERFGERPWLGRPRFGGAIAVDAWFYPYEDPLPGPEIL